MKHARTIAITSAAGALGAWLIASGPAPQHDRESLQYGRLEIGADGARLVTAHAVEALDPPAPLRQGTHWERTEHGRIIEARNERYYYLDVVGSRGWEIVPPAEGDADVYLMVRRR